jgi:mRNA interferase MazF
MTNYKPGDIVLVRFPFTDLTSHKRRPVLVISPSEFSKRFGDIVVIPLTGHSQESGFRLEHWREAGLLKPTWLKRLIATVAESLVEHRLGAIHPRDVDKVSLLLKSLIDIPFRPSS